MNFDHTGSPAEHAEHATVRVVADVSDVDLRDVVAKRAHAVAAKTNGGGASTSTQNGACVLAKHLCGCATDEALRVFVRAFDGAAEAVGSGEQDVVRVSSALLAPCCHPSSVSWQEFCGTPQLMALGFDEKDLEILLQLIALSKIPRLTAGSTGTGGHKKLAALWELGADRIKLLGRLARRTLEHCRLLFVEHVLRRRGISNVACEIVQYVSPAVSPDNLALIIKTRVPCVASALPRKLPGTHALLVNAELPRCGVVLLLKATQMDSASLATRVANYLLERTTAGAASQEHDQPQEGLGVPVAAAWVCSLRRWGGKGRADACAPTAVVMVAVVAGSSVGAALAWLAADPLLAQVVSRASPFEHQASSPADVVSGLKGMRTHATVDTLHDRHADVEDSPLPRVYGSPKTSPAVSATLDELIAEKLVQLKGHSSTLHVTVWDSVEVQLQPPPLLWSVVPLSTWDPAVSLCDSGTTDHNKVVHLRECIARLGQSTDVATGATSTMAISACQFPPVSGRAVTLLVGGAAGTTDALLEWCTNNGAASVHNAMPRRNTRNKQGVAALAVLAASSEAQNTVSASTSQDPRWTFAPPPDTSTSTSTGTSAANTLVVVYEELGVPDNIGMLTCAATLGIIPVGATVLAQVMNLFAMRRQTVCPWSRHLPAALNHQLVYCAAFVVHWGVWLWV